MSFENIVKKAETDIEQYGWSTMYVDANQEQGMESFSYTIGFEKTFDHPEIIIFGLPGESAHRVLSAVAHAVKDGEPMPLDTPVENILGGNFKVLFKPFDPDVYDIYLSVAVRIYKTKNYRTQILLWPDKFGHYPTDPEYSIQGQLSAVKLISSSGEFQVPKLQAPNQLH